MGNITMRELETLQQAKLYKSITQTGIPIQLERVGNIENILYYVQYNIIITRVGNRYKYVIIDIPMSWQSRIHFFRASDCVQVPILTYLPTFVAAAISTMIIQLQNGHLQVPHATSRIGYGTSTDLENTFQFQRSCKRI